MYDNFLLYSSKFDSNFSIMIMISTLTIEMVALVGYVVIHMYDLIICIVASKGGSPFHPKGVLRFT